MAEILSDSSAPTTTTVFDVAEYILSKNAVEHPENPTMSTMKLQKLVYYCQAWHLAWDGRTLFPEEIQAWASGPVCPALYEVHRGIFAVGPGFFAKRLHVRNDIASCE
ncbi:type II toxin-antitoxin system antitoxin SocA domain-containing protein [Arthrobacter sp. efr-133-TYG-118]|uniref:Panacea domain-containing protein n=1 Tax=Arthrobacter sp. efr-133-TYG-118 TaxID=3040279 RepID=UPI00254FA37C|nr:type II toxin-antitoxin system antitoxin SocA domain-containing protein [Arthrobacter sp. efr-133-TYG-118]